MNTNIISVYLQFTEVTTVNIIVTKISGCNRFGSILEIVGNVSICQKWMKFNVSPVTCQNVVLGKNVRQVTIEMNDPISTNA